jgi:hypothetical protein
MLSGWGLLGLAMLLVGLGHHFLKGASGTGS